MDPVGENGITVSCVGREWVERASLRVAPCGSVGVGRVSVCLTARRALEYLFV